MFSPSLGFKNLSKVDFKDWNWGLLAGSICRLVPFIPATCCRILSCALVIIAHFIKPYLDPVYL